MKILEQLNKCLIIDLPGTIDAGRGDPWDPYEVEGQQGFQLSRDCNLVCRFCNKTKEEFMLKRSRLSSLALL